MSTLTSDKTFEKRVSFLRADMISSTFTPVFRYDNIFNRFIENVYCPFKMCSVILCVHEKTVQSLDKSYYQCPQCKSKYHVRNLTFEEQAISFFLRFVHRIQIFEETQISLQDFIGDVICPGSYCSRQTCVYFHTWKKNVKSGYECLPCKTCYQVLNSPFRDRKPTIMLFGGDGTFFCHKKESRLRERKNLSIFDGVPPQVKSGTPKLEAKRGKNIPFLAQTCRIPIG